MILYLKGFKNATKKKKLLEIRNCIGKVSVYKIHMQESVAFQYSNNEQTEKEISETIPLTITSKIIK
jgi:hypothetical protein